MLYADNVTGTSKSITGLTAGTTYSMQVSAVNSAGESAKSTALSVTTNGLGKIAFQGNNEIYVINADGTNQTKLTTPYTVVQPRWSFDGTKIAFVAVTVPPTDIYTMNADGSNQIKLTNSSCFRNEEPRWYPDGSKIIFVSDRDGNREIYIMNADGTNQTRLTDNSADDYNASWSR